MALIVLLKIAAVAAALYGAWRVVKFFVELVGRAPMNDG